MFSVEASCSMLSKEQEEEEAIISVYFDLILKFPINIYSQVLSH